jgi:hypothetical protein
MPLIGDTGNGATATFGTSSLSLSVTAIQIGEITIDMLDVSTLATTDFQEMIASDLKKTPEVSLDVLHVASAVIPTVGGAAETMTVTLPLFTGTTTAARIAGTAQFTSYKLPDLANGQLMMSKVKFKYNGDTGPAYTVAS